MGQEIINLESMIAQCVTQLDYSVQSAADHAAQPRLPQLPAVILYPVTINHMEGGEAVRIKSICEITFVKNAVGADSKALFALQSQIRSDISRLVMMIKEISGVVDVTEVKTSTKESKKSMCEDVRVMLSMSVVTQYNNTPRRA